MAGYDVYNPNQPQQQSDYYSPNTGNPGLLDAYKYLPIFRRAKASQILLDQDIQNAQVKPAGSK